MAYVISVRRTVHSHYDESGNWIEGGYRIVSDDGGTEMAYDEIDDEAYDTPVEWAIDTINRIGADDLCDYPSYSSSTIYEPSVYPIPRSLGEHEYLTILRERGTGECEEATIRLLGDFSDTDRANVFWFATY